MRFWWRRTVFLDWSESHCAFIDTSRKRIPDTIEDLKWMQTGVKKITVLLSERVITFMFSQPYISIDIAAILDDPRSSVVNVQMEK